MTPRPSDEARESLRAARERAGADPAPDAGEHGKPVATRGRRPGDAARAALHEAVRARRAADVGGRKTTTDQDGHEPDGAGDDPGTERGRRGAAVADGPGATLGAGTERSAGEEGDAVAPPGSADRARSRPAPRLDRRPGDVAREALRSAREEARCARTETDGRSTGVRGSDGQGAESGPRSGPTPPGGAPPVPRVTQGDRAADARTAGAPTGKVGASAVRDLLADAVAPPPKPGGPPRGEPPGCEPSTVYRSPLAAVRPASPAVPRTTRSMAAPSRDGELRRTYPEVPSGAPDDVGFATTWWGQAWVTALEDGALDAAWLVRGRQYAGLGHVDAVTVTPGLVLAYVQGSRPRPYRVRVRLRALEDDEWERFLDVAADRPGHIAALLDKEMPQSLADCGVPLLPRPGELVPRCGCSDSGHPCEHTAALCYQTARLLDADPLALLLLRGRGEHEVTDALSRLSAARTARAGRGRGPKPLPGVRAREAVVPRVLPPLPAPLPPPPHPGQPPVHPAVPGGPDPFALDQLATDAAARAHALLATGHDPVGRLTLWQDAVRLAAARPGSGLTAATRTLYSSLARAAGCTPAELARAVAAWRQGGPAGLEVLETTWDPPAGRFDRARPSLLAAGLPAFRPRHNHLTHPRGDLQLRLGRDHLWYAYESEPGHDDWWPRGTPAPNPVGALTSLGISG